VGTIIFLDEMNGPTEQIMAWDKVYWALGIVFDFSVSSSDEFNLSQLMKFQ
jgi:hypothetical protein